jgi:uncharacterized protein (DUF433 family)
MAPQGQSTVTADPKVMGGSPVVQGTRVPVYVILDELAAGRSFEQILQSYPSLTLGGIEAAIRYAFEGRHDLAGLRSPTIENLNPQIVIDPELWGGVPCIRGTRIPVYVVLENLEGHTFDEIIADYPSLTPETIRAAIQFAADVCGSDIDARTP